MKKFVYGVLGVIGVLVIAIIIVSAGQEEVVVASKNNVISKFENDESFLLVIGTSTCGYCVNYKETTLVQYIKTDREYPLEFIYSDQSNFLGQSDFVDFLQTYGITYSASPTTYLVQNGQIVASQSGLLSLKELEQFIKENK